MAAQSKILTCSCYELGHTWDPSCWRSFLEIAKAGFTESFRIYSSLYVLTALLSKKKKEYYKKKIVPQVLRSTLFLGTNACLFMGAFCVWRKLAGFFFFYNVFACGIPAGVLSISFELPQRRLLGQFTYLSSSFIPAYTAAFIAILLERPSRRVMLATYMANVATELAFNMAVSRGVITPIKHGEVLLFSVIVSVYMYLFRKPDGLRDSARSALRFIVGSAELPPSIERDNNNQATVQSSKAESSPPRRRPKGPSLLSFLPPNLQALVHLWRQGPRHKLCRHHHSCLASAVEGSLRMFGVGYAVQAVVKLLGALPRVFRNPRGLVNALKDGDNFYLGAFLATFTGTFKAVNCLLRWARNKDSSVHGLISGFLAGWSMMWYKSASVALFLGSKLGEILYLRGIEAGVLPYIKYADVAIYSFCTSLVFHAAVFEPHNLRPAYWKFLLRITNGRFAAPNHKLLDEAFGTKSMTLFR